MINAEQLATFKKFNKKAREIRAKRLGYASAAAYIAFLSGGVLVEPVALVTIPKEPKKASAKLSVVPTIHIVDIADKSGSMEGDKDAATVSGINEGIKDLILSTDQVNYTHTYVDFASDIRIVHVCKDPLSVKDITLGTRGSTALWDAISDAVKAVADYVKDGHKVLVNIYTDGGENASRRNTAQNVQQMIREYSQMGWTFTFVGTQYDVNYVNSRINIDLSNTRVYDGTAKGMADSMQATRFARVQFTNSVLKGEDVSKGFYKNIL